MISKENDIFFATSFSGHVDYETGNVNQEFRDRIEDILRSLREVGGFAVYCAVEAEGWKISQQEPGVSMKNNFSNIARNSIFLALVDSIGSDGRGVETEHAIHRGKSVFLTTGPDEELSWVMQELVALGRAEHIPYKAPSELVTVLMQRIEAKYQPVEISLDDFLSTGYSERSAKRTWSYLVNFANNNHEFPLRPSEHEGRLDGNIDKALEWIRTNTPEVAKYETFRMLKRVQHKRLSGQI